jgi:hypothetical protein
MVAVRSLRQRGVDPADVRGPRAPCPRRRFLDGPVAGTRADMNLLIGVLVAIAIIWIIIVLVAHLPIWLIALILLLIIVGVAF